MGCTECVLHDVRVSSSKVHAESLGLFLEEVLGLLVHHPALATASAAPLLTEAGAAFGLPPALAAASAALSLFPLGFSGLLPLGLVSLLIHVDVEISLTWHLLIDNGEHGLGSHAGLGDLQEGVRMVLGGLTSSAEVEVLLHGALVARTDNREDATAVTSHVGMDYLAGSLARGALLFDLRALVLVLQLVLLLLKHALDELAGVGLHGLLDHLSDGLLASLSVPLLVESGLSEWDLNPVLDDHILLEGLFIRGGLRAAGLLLLRLSFVDRCLLRLDLKLLHWLDELGLDWLSLLNVELEVDRALSLQPVVGTEQVLIVTDVDHVSSVVSVLDGEVRRLEELLNELLETFEGLRHLTESLRLACSCELQGGLLARGTHHAGSVEERSIDGWDVLFLHLKWVI